LWREDQPYPPADWSLGHSFKAAFGSKFFLIQLSNFTS
jgi:hypothetical protein